MKAHPIVRVRAKKPRTLPPCGTGGLHDDQQYCYDLGYREGIAALRRAQRNAIKTGKVNI